MGTSTAALELLVTLRDEASSKMSGVGNTISTAFGMVTGGLITRGIDAITGSVGGLIDGMVNGNAEFERYQTQFGVLLGGAEAAKQRLDELAKFGASTPFELPEVVKADKILQGFGLHSEEAAKKFGMSGEQIRTIAGDVASGTGSSFEEMSLLIGKFSAGATGEAISRMAELGITNRDELKKMGLEFDKSGALLSPLPQAMEVVLGQMKQKFGGMMEAQSGTFEGMMSNLQDWAAGTLRTVGQPIFEVLSEKLKGLLQILSSPAVQAAITGFATFMADGIGKVIDIITTLTDDFEDAFSEGGIAGVINAFVFRLAQLFGATTKEASAMGETFYDVFTTAQNVFGSITGLITRTMTVFGNEGLLGAIRYFAIQVANMFGIVEEDAFSLGDTVSSAVGGLIGFVQTILPVMLTTFQNVFNGIAGIVSTVIPIIIDIVGNALRIVSEFWAEHGDEIIAFVKDAWSTISDIISIALELIQNIIVPILTAIGQFLAEHGDTIKTVFQVAWTVISTVIRVALDVIKTIISLALAVIKGDTQSASNILQGIWSNLRTAIINIVNGIGTAVSAKFNEIKNSITGAIQSAYDSVLAFVKKFTDFGAAIVNGIVEGLKNAAASLNDFFGNLLKNALDAAISLLPPAIQGLIKQALGIGGGVAGSVAGSSVAALPPPSGQFARGGSASGTAFVFNIDARGATDGPGAIENAVDKAMLRYGRRADARIRTA